MSNPAIASKTERKVPIDCKPTSFEDRNHVWLLELQPPCKTQKPKLGKSDITQTTQRTGDQNQPYP